VLSTKAEHGACPEMISPELVARTGQVDTIVCHTDFDGLASAAKWMRAGIEPYPGCDDDARAIDTRMGTPSRVADRIDRALRGCPHDMGLFGLVVRLLSGGLSDDSLWMPVDDAAAELLPVERETQRAAESYKRVPPGVAIVRDSGMMSIAAAFDSGWDFVELFALGGGMPTRVTIPETELDAVVRKINDAPAPVPRGSAAPGDREPC